MDYSKYITKKSYNDIVRTPIIQNEEVKKDTNSQRGFKGQQGGMRGEIEITDHLKKNGYDVTLTKPNTPYHDATIKIGEVTFYAQIKTDVSQDGKYPPMKTEDRKKLIFKARMRRAIPILIEHTLNKPRDHIFTDLRTQETFRFKTRVGKIEDK